MIGSDIYHIVIDFLLTDSDYRYSNIEIIEIDINIEPTTKTIPTSSNSIMSLSSKLSTNTIEPIKAKSIGDGVIRLFREFYDDENEEEYQQVTQGDDTMLAILALPTYFTATDLLGYIGESFISSISHIRILKSDKQNRFLVLIKFRDIFKAAQFKNYFDGKSFNSMEPESCHVVYVRSVQLNYPTQEIEELETLIPFLLQDPFTSKLVTEAENLSNKSLIELPTCPVCLEKMDSSMTGLLTIPCQHTFHCQCLSKWKDDSCPICRYSHKLTNLSIIKNQSNRLLNRRESVNNNSEVNNNNSDNAITEEYENCSECSESSNLWICLICGNVGCSRYAPEQHSLKHFINTGHCFAMEISTSRVWDYAGDNYVHRLVTNESDGKLVELPDNEKSSKYSAKSNNNDIDKVDAVGFEYSQLLISQLASQREYYEEILNNNYNIDGSKFLDNKKEFFNSNNTDINKNIILSQTNNNNNQYSDLESKVEDLSVKLSDLTTNLIPSLKSKIQNKEEKLHKISIELNTQNLLNEAFSKKIEHLNLTNKEHLKVIEDLKLENEGLKEQNNDLMFYLDSNQKFENQPEDVKQGKVVIQQPPSTTSSSLKKKKKKKPVANKN
ncbi:hypothetical protein KGF54_004501 [Candida jiufengensis]|uniref:uncharacterized protein n=1 Tax=Candida jiufengensis TaxID=497108 RepID=UPI002224EBD8|nr:uncharacterized protein KGF54_004501 [Candida jiufengensis]KAI5951427.1 hypothetical protein KGF54_004501 [Candida jiufengensis]